MDLLIFDCVFLKHRSIFFLFAFFGGGSHVTEKEKKKKQRLLFVDLIDLNVLHFVESFDKRHPPSAHSQEKLG